MRADSAFYGHGRGRCRGQGRRGGLGHRPLGQEGQGRHRRDQRGRVDHDRVPRRGLRRAHRAVDLPRGGRRDRLRRVHLQAEGRPGARPAGGAPDPGPQHREHRRRSGHPVRAVAPPRVLHHHTSRGRRHRRCRQDPPWPRDHRAGPRRPEGLRAGAPAVGEVQRQRRLAGARGDGVQPHPRRRSPGRTTSSPGRPPAPSAAN